MSNSRQKGHPAGSIRRGAAWIGAEDDGVRLVWSDDGPKSGEIGDRPETQNFARTPGQEPRYLDFPVFPDSA